MLPNTSTKCLLYEMPIIGNIHYTKGPLYQMSVRRDFLDEMSIDEISVYQLSAIRFDLKGLKLLEIMQTSVEYYIMRFEMATCVKLIRDSTKCPDNSLFKFGNPCARIS